MECARHNHLFIEQDGIDHLQHRSGWCKVCAAGAKQLDNFGSTITRALHNLLDALSRNQLRNRHSCYRTHTGKWHHSISVSTQYICLYITHRYIEFLCDKGAEPRRIQYTGHTNHTVTWETADMVSKLGHSI